MSRRARILGVDIRRRVATARAWFKETGGKSILDCPGRMIEIRVLMRQLADDAEMLLDAREAEREGVE